MPIPEVRVTFSDAYRNLAEDYQQQVRTVADDVLLDLADESQRQSPVGATGNLKKDWDVIPAKRRIGQVFGSIVNKSEAAYHRIVGRGPGKMPPYQPIADWVAKKIKGSPSEKKSITYLIRRKIGREGTERWKRRENILELGRDQPVEESPVFQRARQEIIRRVDAIAIPKRKRR